MRGMRLEVRGVTKNLGGRSVLSDLSLVAEEGEILVLLGPSGSGKTTLLNLIAGLVAPDAGEVVIGGRVASSASTFVEAKDRRVGLVFQNYALWPHMTVYENVAFPLRVRGADEERVRTRVEEMLQFVSLKVDVGKYPRQLSGGESQRVALARALIVEPEILLLDEPLSSLDEALRLGLIHELRRLQRKLGVTTVWVTHDPGEALEVADTLAVMLQGRIVQSGSPEEVYRRPASIESAKLLGRLNVLPALLFDRGASEGSLVAFRPHDAVLETDSADGSIEGTAEEFGYNGREYYCTVRVGEHRIEVPVAATQRPDPGAIVGVRVDQSSLLRFG